MHCKVEEKYSDKKDDCAVELEKQSKSINSPYFLHCQSGPFQRVRRRSANAALRKFKGFGRQESGIISIGRTHSFEPIENPAQFSKDA